jgi:hypothetical protein
MTFSAQCLAAFTVVSALLAGPAGQTQDRVANSRSELAARVQEFDKWTDPSMADITDEAQALERFSAILPELQKLFRPGAKIAVDGDETALSAWAEKKESVSPQEFARRVGRIAFTSGSPQVAAGEVDYVLEGDRATVRMKRFLLDPDDVVRSVVIEYEMAWVAGPSWQIKELKKIVRKPNETELKEIGRAIEKGKLSIR